MGENMYTESRLKRIYKKLIGIGLALLLVTGGSLPHLYNEDFAGHKRLRLDPNITQAYAGTVADLLLVEEDLTIEDGVVKGFSTNGQTKFDAAKTANGDIKLDLKNISATVIGEKAFENQGIAEINLAVGTTVIGSRAFAGNNLSTFDITENVTDIASDAFDDNPDFKVWNNRDFVFRGFSVDGFSALGAKKVKFFKDLVLPTENAGIKITHTDGNTDLNPVPFANQGLTSLVIPEGYGRISEGIFQNNKITELVIPGSVHNIHRYAFRNNPLKRVVFEDNTTQNQKYQIDRGAFLNCPIEDLEFKGDVNEIGGWTFAKNKITDLTMPRNGMNVIGYEIFKETPLESVRGLNPIGGTFQWGAFGYTKTLKNVNFDAYNYDKNIIPYETFMKGKLKSLEIPSSINVFKGTVSSGAIDLDDSLTSGGTLIRKMSMPFAENPGWYNNNGKVALYRKTKGADGKLASGAYVTDNAVADDNGHVFNPVLVKFDMEDLSGASVTNVSEHFTIKRIRNSAEEDISSKVIVEDSENFKLGDTIIVTPKKEDINLTNHNLTKDGNSYRIDLSGAAVSEKSYGDGYDVGYKTADVILKHKKSSGSGTKPSKPDTPELPKDPEKPEEPPKEPETPPVTPPETPKDPEKPIEPIKEIPPVDPPKGVPYEPKEIKKPEKMPDVKDPVLNIINEERTPLGKASVDLEKGNYTFIEDEAVPLGTAQIGNDNVLEILEINDEEVPLSAMLPKTGGYGAIFPVLIGAVMLALGAIMMLKRKTNRTNR